MIEIKEVKTKREIKTFVDFPTKLYATKVSFVFASDEKTQNGMGDTITIHSVDSYVMIAGEKDIPIQETGDEKVDKTIKSGKEFAKKIKRTRGNC